MVDLISDLGADMNFEYSIEKKLYYYIFHPEL